MEQNPSWEANSHSAFQELSCLLWNLKVHYHVHNSLPLILTLSQMHPFHTFQPYFPKIYSDIILPSVLASSSVWSLPFRFSKYDLSEYQNLISLAQEPIVYVLLYFNKPEIITHDYQIETCNVTVSLFYILQKLVLNKSCMF